MKKNKKAFTLAEILVCLGVIMVIAAVIMPSVWSKSPNKNKSLMKKTYKIAENTIYDILNDEEYYPIDEAASAGLAYFRPKDTTGTKKYYLPETTYEEEEKRTGQKFCKLFARKLNIGEGDNCTKADDSSNYEYFIKGKMFKPTFVTNDGAAWLFTRNTIIEPTSGVAPTDTTATKCANLKQQATPKEYTCIFIDVNGSQPNDTSTDNAPNSMSGKNADRYVIVVDYDGKMTLPEATSREYIFSNSIY